MRSSHGRLAGLACGALMLLSACAQQGTPARAQPQPTAKARAASPTVTRSTEGSDAAASCNAKAVKDVLGQVPTASLAESARKQAGARSVRVIHHGKMITKEFLGTRLNLQLDAAGKVAEVYCG